MEVTKPIGPEISITTANTVGGNVLIRVVNTGAAGVLHLISNTAVEYANLTITNSAPVFIRKANTDTLTGASMLACPVAYIY